MAHFAYKARNKQSEWMEDSCEAENRAQVIQLLIQKELTPISIEEVKPPKKSIDLRWLIPATRKPQMKPDELRVFTRQLGSILKAGISLLNTLELLHKQMRPKSASVVKDIIEAIRAGASFSDALSRHPTVFNEAFVSMVKVGEAGGILTDVLERMASMLEYTEENRQRIKTALRYPKIVLGIMILAFVVIVTVIVPKFANVFKTLGSDLPLPTQILLTSYQIISGYWFILVPVLIASYFTFIKWRKGPGQLIFDRWMLKVPIFGPLTLKNNISIFARFFASLYRSGVHVTDVLSMSSRIVDNKVIANLIEEMKRSAMEGQSLATPLKKTKIFPDLSIQMIMVGENTGALSEMFDKLAGYFEAEVDQTIKQMSSLIEPFLIIGLGAMVLLIALGVFLPMWNMTKAFKESLGQ